MSIQYDRRVTLLPVSRRLLAKLLGSAFLAALVIGSGVAAQTPSPGEVGRELLENRHRRPDLVILSLARTRRLGSATRQREPADGFVSRPRA